MTERPPQGRWCAADWNRKWQASGHVRAIAERDRYYGANGVFVKMVRRHIDGLQGRRVLELGAGRSYRLLALARWCGASAVGLDYSPVGIEQLKAIFSANGCRVEAILADLFTWDGGRRRFDTVLHWGLLEHFRDPVPLMRVCGDLVSPGGVVLFTMPNMEAWGAYLWRHWSPSNWAQHVYHSDEAVRAACASAGLELKKTFYWGVPMLRITTWEREGILPSVVTAVARALKGVGQMMPCYQYGSRRVSSERGFVARKPISTRHFQ